MFGGRLSREIEYTIDANNSISPTDMIEHRIVGLEPNTMYRVVVYATTRIGPGDQATLDVMTADKARRCSLIGRPYLNVYCSAKTNYYLLQFLRFDLQNYLYTY